MADFRTHITVSTGLGMAYGTAGYAWFDIPFEHAMIATGLCSVGGMMPDLDSASSVPHREMLSIISVLAPVLMLPRFEELGMSKEQIVVAAGFIFLFVRYVLGAIFLKYTRHRGMWHSLPAAMIAGLATYLVCHCNEFGIRLFKSWAVVIGFVSHLVLDEIYAVDWEGKRIRVKRSFGTALKFASPHRNSNMFTYAVLVLLLGLIFSDQYVMQSVKQQYRQSELRKSTKEWLKEWFTRSAESDETLLR